MLESKIKILKLLKCIPAAYVTINVTIIKNNSNIFQQALKLVVRCASSVCFRGAHIARVFLPVAGIFALLSPRHYSTSCVGWILSFLNPSKAQVTNWSLIGHKLSGQCGHYF